MSRSKYEWVVLKSTNGRENPQSICTVFPVPCLTCSAFCQCLLEGVKFVFLCRGLCSVTKADIDLLQPRALFDLQHVCYFHQGPFQSFLDSFVLHKAGLWLGSEKGEVVCAGEDLGIPIFPVGQRLFWVWLFMLFFGGKKKSVLPKQRVMTSNFPIHYL